MSLSDTIFGYDFKDDFKDTFLVTAEAEINENIWDSISKRLKMGWNQFLVKRGVNRSRLEESRKNKEDIFFSFQEQLIGIKVSKETIRQEARENP